ncbi:glycosyltransferase family 21 protein [Dothidotthia symphoricarpi CBS 119687]|uniref:Ceramide glucosyltransferase n=1 Tax=Dothidotthia symphoricarpi CBS 119687 TaxID=1392245 RepID=A0A6A6A1Y6_9PLEO|nr:glycosyltransferase family 21 protein [Dothidotthia symphoricarpi CBS 119687]KAF2125546.1 glycosyltransferase family 21 protein [Dothidotthia symphoricarpi CBS 119687]
MTQLSHTNGALAPASGADDIGLLRTIIASGCLVWFVFIWLVCGIGFTQLFRYYSTRPQPAVCVTKLPATDVPHVTVIRPVKGLEPRLYECLAATLRQTYPAGKIDTVFCVEARSDPAFSILERLCRDFPRAQVRILVEEEDPLLLGGGRDALGPNPKIRNMSRAYREARGDVVWILDCNVWVGKGVCGRMVDLLCGFGEGKPTRYKFVHQTPVVVDLDSQTMTVQNRKELLGGRPETHPDEAEQATQSAAAASSTPPSSSSALTRLLQRAGGRLDEAFLSSAHAKFYLAINTVAVAPCVIGKSTMFRPSQLNHITASNPLRAPGIDYFSDNICEDHLIGDALWKVPQPFEQKGSKEEGGDKGGKWNKHAMLFGDLCFQPTSHTPVAAYLHRRIRWLRVRKFTVTLATFVEPGTESLVCGAYGAYALTTLPFFARMGIPGTWAAFLAIFLSHTALWCASDYLVYLLLHCAKTLEIDSHTPDFVLPTSSAVTQPLLPKQPQLRDGARRTFPEFLAAWLGREVSALPVWIVAFWGGVTVEWRGRRFWVGLDMRVHEIVDEGEKKGDGKGEGKRKD